MNEEGNISDLQNTYKDFKEMLHKMIHYISWVKLVENDFFFFALYWRLFKGKATCKEDKILILMTQYSVLIL